MGWRLDWLTSWDEVWSPENVARWRALVTRPDAHVTPFVTPGMARAWVDAVGGHGGLRPRFLWARDAASGQEVAWPMAIVQGGVAQGAARQLVPIGATLSPMRIYEGLYDYNDPIVAPAAPGPCVLAPGFWPALRAELDRRAGPWFDRCILEKLRAPCFEDGAPPELDAVGSRTGVRPEPLRVAPYLDLDRYAGYADYLAARSTSMRNDIRRHGRKLEALGDVRFHMHGPQDLDLVRGWLPALEAARRARYPEARMPARLLANVVTEAAAEGMLRASSIAVDGRGISWDIGLWQAGVYYGYVRSFDQSLAHASPGTAHTARLVAWTLENGGRRLDLLIGDETYKSRWTDGLTEVVGGLRITSRAYPSKARMTLARVARRMADRRAART